MRTAPKPPPPGEHTVSTSFCCTRTDPFNGAGLPLIMICVLAEAQHEWFKRASQAGSKGDNEPVTLGPVGGRIVAETLIGMVYGDGHSYLQQDPNWEPTVGGRKVTMGNLISYALTGAK